MYVLADINEIVETHDLYRNKDDFWKCSKQKVLIFLTKIFHILKWLDTFREAITS